MSPAFTMRRAPSPWAALPPYTCLEQLHELLLHLGRQLAARRLQLRRKGGDVARRQAGMAADLRQAGVGQRCEQASPSAGWLGHSRALHTACVACTACCPHLAQAQKDFQNRSVVLQ